MSLLELVKTESISPHPEHSEGPPQLGRDSMATVDPSRGLA